MFPILRNISRNVRNCRNYSYQYSKMNTSNSFASLPNTTSLGAAPTGSRERERERLRRRMDRGARGTLPFAWDRAARSALRAIDPMAAASVFLCLF